MKDLLYLTSSSSAFIQKKTLTENNVSGNVYYLYKMSNMQLNNEAFTRNNLMKYLLEMVLNSSAMIQNKTFIENNVSRTVYKLQRESNVQLNNLFGILWYYSKQFVWNSIYTFRHEQYAIG